jgi:acetyl-CoA carboxylase biotin carboxyl carrier protein
MSSAPKKAPSAKTVPAKSAPATTLGLDDIKALIALVAKENVHEFEFETGAVRFRIRKDGAPAQTLAAPLAQAPAPVFALPAAAPAPAAPPPAPAEDPNLHYITSPIVGTFYRAPSPTAPNFVQPGDFIRPGQTLCIVEAMKLMNEIESDVAGEVVRVLVENGQPVEYGERIFAIRVG